MPSSYNDSTCMVSSAKTPTSLTLSPNSNPRLPGMQLALVASVALSLVGEQVDLPAQDTPAMNEYDTERVGHPIHPAYHPAFAVLPSTATRINVPTATTSTSVGSEHVNQPKCGACRRLKNKIVCVGGFPCNQCRRKGWGEQQCRSESTFADQRAKKIKGRRAKMSASLRNEELHPDGDDSRVRLAEEKG